MRSPGSRGLRRRRRLQIAADGPHILVDLNGVRRRLYGTNPDPRFLAAGVLALQTYGAENHAGWVKFRNVKVRSLPG